MSDYEHKDGNGSIFQNKFKKTEKHPDMKGEIKIDGKVYEFGVYEKRSKSGNMFLAISGARLKGEKQTFSNQARPKQDYQAPIKSKPSVPDDFEDSIPFAKYKSF